MPNKTIRQNITEFSSYLQEMNRTYEAYAKKYNFSYTTMQIINLINEVEDCTQKKICELTFLPKQTVNSIITALYKEELIDLIVNPTNRRLKTIIFTNKGQELVQEALPKVREAELSAMESLTEEERNTMLKGMALFCRHLNEKML